MPTGRGAGAKAVITEHLREPSDVAGSGTGGESRAVMADHLLRWLRDESGQDLVEYGLLAALISVAAVAVMLSASEEIGGLWGTIRDGLQDLI